MKRISVVACSALILATPSAVVAQDGSTVATGRVQTEPRPSGTVLVRVNLRGKETLLPGLEPRRAYGDPVLSADGKRIAFTAVAPLLPPTTSPPPLAPNEIIVYALPAGPIVRLPVTGRASFLSWVGKTGDLSFIRHGSRNDSTPDLVVRNADGNGPERVILSGEIVALTGAVWAPDGKSFLVTHQGTPAVPRGEILFFALANLKKPIRIVATDLLLSNPVISPDGRNVAYVGASPRKLSSGTIIPSAPRIFVKRIAGGPPVPVLRPGGNYPTWSADGKKLFFVSSSSRGIYSVRVRPTNTPMLDPSLAISSYALENTGSVFAALPGDSLFVVRRRPAIPESPDVAPEVRGVRADSATQKSLEILAAVALAPIAGDKRVDLTRLALDSRSYIFSLDPTFAAFPLEIKSYLLPGRDDAHRSALGAIMGTAGEVSDKTGCEPAVPPPSCHRGSFAGTLDFSPAVVSADSARLYMHAWLAGPVPANVDNVSVGIVNRWSFTFVRRGTEWFVRRVE